MTDQIYKNKFLFYFNNQLLEKLFKIEQHSTFIKWNPWLTLFTLTISIIDVIVGSIYHKEGKIRKLPFIELTSITSYVIISMVCLEFILVFFIKNYYFQKFITYSNYILIMFPFVNLREGLFNFGYIEKNIYAMIRSFELLYRIIIIFLALVPIPDGYIVNLILFIVACIYAPFVGGVQAISLYASQILIQLVITYFQCKQIKTNFYINYSMQEQNKWYINLFEHMNSGFMSFKKNKINFLNKNFREFINKLKESKNILLNNGKSDCIFKSNNNNEKDHIQ